MTDSRPSSASRADMWRGRILEISDDSYYVEFEDEGTTLGADFYISNLPEGATVGDIIDFDTTKVWLADLGFWTQEELDHAKAEGARMAAEWAELSD